MLPETDTATPSTVHRARLQIPDRIPSPHPDGSSTYPYQSEGGSCSRTQLINGNRAASTPPERPNRSHDKRFRSQTSTSATTNTHPPWLQTSLSKKKSQYFDAAFACRDSANTPKSKGLKDFLVTAEVKLNYCPPSDQDFLIDFTFLLSEIYQRPAGCVMVLLNTDLSILFESSSDAAYQISLTALSTEIAATRNRRTAGLIQDFMSEAVHIPASRGVFIFNPVVEENVVAECVGKLAATHKTQGQRTRESETPDNTAQGNNRRKVSSYVRPPIASGSIVAAGRADTPCPSDQLTFERVESVKGKRPNEGKVKKRKSLMALLGF